MTVKIKDEIYACTVLSGQKGRSKDSMGVIPPIRFALWFVIYSERKRPDHDAPVHELSIVDENDYFC